MPTLLPGMFCFGSVFRLHTTFGFSYVFRVRLGTALLNLLSRFLASPIIIAKLCVRFRLNMPVVFSMVFCYGMAFLSNMCIRSKYLLGLELVMTLN